MSAITEARAQLVQLLAGDDGTGAAVRLVHDAVPEEPAPPCWIVQPAEDFVSADPTDETFGGDDELVIRFEVVQLVELYDNATATAELDDELATLLGLLRTSAWWVVSIGQPGAQYTSDWLHHGVRVTVASRITL